MIYDKYLSIKFKHSDACNLDCSTEYKLKRVDTILFVNGFNDQTAPCTALQTWKWFEKEMLGYQRWIEPLSKDQDCMKISWNKNFITLPFVIIIYHHLSIGGNFRGI